jgi:hypothetical protein
VVYSILVRVNFRSRFIIGESPAIHRRTAEKNASIAEGLLTLNPVGGSTPIIVYGFRKVKFKF